MSKYYVGLFLIFIYIRILSCYYHCEIKLRWLLWNRHKLLNWISFGACWLSEAPSTHVATYILTQDPPVVGTNHSPTYGYGFWPDRVWKPNGDEHSMLTITPPSRTNDEKMSITFDEMIFIVLTHWCNSTGKHYPDFEPTSCCSHSIMLHA